VVARDYLPTVAANPPLVPRDPRVPEGLDKAEAPTGFFLSSDLG